MKKILLVLSVLFFVVGLNLTDDVFAKETIKIGLTACLSGQGARTGLKAQKGAMVAVDEINKAGGILGKDFELVVEDHKGEPTEATSAANKLIFQNKVNVLIADTFSSAIFAVEEMIKMKDIPMPTLSGIVTVPKITKQGNKWYFRANQNALMEGPPYVGFWVKELKIKKISFIAPNDDWGRSTVETYVDVLRKLGGEATTVDYFTLGVQDFYPYLTKIKAKKPDAISVTARPEEASRISIQMGELAMLGMFPVVGGSGQTTDDYIQLAGKTAEGLWLLTRYEPVIDTPRNKRFVEAYKKLTDELPDDYAQAGYDNIYIFAEAIRKAGSLDPNKIRDALTKTNYNGLASNIQFDRNNQAHPDLYIVRIENGIRRIKSKVETIDVDYAK